MKLANFSAFLTVWTLCGVAQASSGHRRLAEHCHEQVSFIGFSGNERTMALRTLATCPRPDHSADQIQIVEVLDASTGRLIGAYQDVPAWNQAHGQRSLLSRAELAFYYPPMREVLGGAAWRHTAKVAQFRAHRHDFKSAAIRLRLPPNAAQGPSVQLVAQNAALTVTPGAGAQRGQSFVINARLADGTHVDVAKLQSPASGRAPAQLSVFYSPPGHRLALLWQVDGHTELASYSTPADARFGANDIGAANVLNGTAEEVETLYKSMHPDTAKVWDENVGDLS